MSGLQRFEQRLEQFVSGAFARVFGGAVQPVEISAALQREVDNNAQVLSRDRRLVPNSFHVELAPGDLERLAPYDSTLARELTESLRDHAEHQGYVFPGPVKIQFEGAEDLTTGRFRIRSVAQAKVTSQATDTQLQRARWVLRVNGVEHPVTAAGLVIGRGSSADLQINDPGISREHARFRLDGDRLSVQDLGSTNGILIDGNPAQSASLYDGSTVRMGNTTLTVSQVTDV
jgi:hypothetical protein